MSINTVIFNRHTPKNARKKKENRLTPAPEAVNCTYNLYPAAKGAPVFRTAGRSYKKRALRRETIGKDLLQHGKDSKAHRRKGF